MLIASAKKYPPSPPSYPFVGQTFEIPQTKPWLYFRELGKTYGSIVRLSLGGDEVLLVNDAEDALELLSRRSSNYSSRKQLVYGAKYQSKGKRLVHMNYGEELRKQRAAFHNMFQPRAVGAYQPLQERASLRLLRSILEKPREMWMNTKEYAASIVYMLSYGKDLKDGGEDLKTILDIVDGFVRDCMPGAHLVDTFPILDVLPDILSPWRKEASDKHMFEMRLYQRLLLEAKDKTYTATNDGDCFASRVWADKDKHQLDLVSMSYLVGSAVEAGTDTPTSTILFFLAAAVLYPDAYRKAQQEIDSVVGADGSMIPTFANVDDLPYCFAYAKEVLRWMPTAPVAFPHFSDRDDEYKGYFIRGKTTIVPNVWSMHRNEEAHPNPSKFIPERYFEGIKRPIKLGDLTEGHYGFGFGRRSCPGKYLAVQTVWIAIVRVIWGFNIGHARDENGNIIPVDPMDCIAGITTKPKEFPLEIRCRSSVHEETMKRVSDGIM
ncbi:cytochrome P450 [Schizopora paradoxa]|uniref:Cytochrome P450 n=1 Tax=Schizopora paradoxa TaxID=27342 RepID=A0A0H2S0R5_9AGAM|nr:cytochrome P450 [Schizopora paradoxa]